jgi:hypothetical protein
MNTNTIGRCKAVHREAEHIHTLGWGHICTELYVAAIGLRVGQEAVGVTVGNLPGGRWQKGNEWSGPSGA